MDTIIKILISYLLGSISGSLVLGKLKGVDIRTMGSGNAGGTNAFRTQGFLFALGVVLIDILKGYIAAGYVARLDLPLGLSGFSIAPGLVSTLCGTAAIIGHVYPVFYGFKGGKGAGAAIGMILAIFPLAVVPAVVIWLFTLFLTGYVGLGTMLAAASIPVFSYWSTWCTNSYFITFSGLLAAFIVYTHRSNIQRMLQGNENRFEKAMILRRHR